MLISLVPVPMLYKYCASLIKGFLGVSPSIYSLNNQKSLLRQFQIKVECSGHATKQELGISLLFN